ncbi:hypothetical protein [Candidatus Endomicrobiellum agilis]|uniref:hypothetical protein n=1 Tax=Candidatus Endomicrobiellum agilis TaxID=3238957 RepID=UPI0035859499|nr:hypothetical protein [Endomicrobium sp.]
MKKVISAILTLLLASGCVVPPRQLSKSDAVTNVTESVQTEPLQETPADICPEQQKCPVLQQKSTKGYWIAIVVLSLACAASLFGLYKQYQKTVQWHNLYNLTNAKKPGTSAATDEKLLQDEIDRLTVAIRKWELRESELVRVTEHPDENLNSPFAKSLRLCKEELAECKNTITKWSLEVQRLVGILNHHNIDVQTGNKK